LVGTVAKRNTQKGDILNEVSMGTFLTRLDTQSPSEDQRMAPWCILVALI
jgi:hypothetical protein